MERVSQFRSRLLLLLFAGILVFYAVKLYDLQIIQTGGGSTDNTTTFTTMTRVKAARGDILDTNGNVLVGNRASYDLVLNHYVLTSSENPNEQLYRLVSLCLELGIEYNDTFPVTVTRPFTYTLDQYNSTRQGYFQKYLKDRGNLDSDITAPLLIETLRKSYDIPEAWTDEEARLIIGLRYELSLRGVIASLPTFVFITDASDEVRSAILELNIPGMNVEASTVREYYTSYADHILGYVGSMSPAQWEKYKEIGGYSMDAEVGQSGFELAFEQYLKGTDGWRYDTVDQQGNVIRSYYDPAPIAGKNVETTIDINLQIMAEDQLQIRLDELRNQEKEDADGKDVQGGAVVVIEVQTGKILAMASNPTYDLANFHETYNEILEADYDPLVNRALQATYPPGSTYKMSMVIAAVRAGYINMETEIETKGIYDVYAEAPGNFAPTCLQWSRHKLTHGFINAAHALCVSCNYFFYDLADHISIDIMDETAKAMGLGEYTGVELPEKQGYRANATTKAIFHEGDDAGFYTADKIMAGIGQSENKFTPLQLCVYASTLANKGRRMSATFLNRVVSTDYRELVLENQPKVVSTLNIPNDAYLSYMEGMQLVASDPEGTAYRIFKNYPIAVAAKTGTAQTGINGTSDHGAFLCFAPADSTPQIAIAVFGERAGSGSGMASVAKAILDVYFEVGEIGDVLTYENKVS